MTILGLAALTGVAWFAVHIVRCIRLDNGDPNQSSMGGQKWSAMAPEWLASIEVLDI